MVNRQDQSSANAEGIGLWAQVREDWVANGRDWTLPGFRALALHRFGQWRMRIRPRVLRMPLSFIYKQLFRFVRNHYGIELPCTARIGRRVIIAHQGTIVFHENAEVGDDCLIRHGVTLGAASHRHAHDAPRLSSRVQVGAGAMILGRIDIGEGAAIGANVVVTTDVPAGAKVVMQPAHIILPEEAEQPRPARPASDSRAIGGRFSRAPLPALLLSLQQVGDVIGLGQAASQYLLFS